VNVASVNDAPVAVGSIASQSSEDADTGISIATASAFSDVDHATLSYSASGLPAGLTINAATGEITGTIDNSASQGGTGGLHTVVITAT
ncbi:putative Ig domain-containing protein, partial [Escherichia coli]|uniref:putative Ig domain-containing protein n=1 Tax=Escherichia coli TaxID=562 RepID=UPI0028DFDEC2